MNDGVWMFTDNESAEIKPDLWHIPYTLYDSRVRC